MIGLDLKTPPLAEQIAVAIEVQREADTTIARLRGDSDPPDALHAAAVRVWAQYGPAGLVEFHRRVQRALERSTCA